MASEEIELVAAGSPDPLVDHRATTQDKRDMDRMGLQPRLIRYFRLRSSIALDLVSGPDWIVGSFYLNPGLINGGPSVLIWATIIHAICFIPIYVSMAEMASIAPISGAQYHWVSEFSPRGLQKLLSYYTGWFSILAWQSANAAGFLLTGTIVQTIISIANPSYTAPRYQGFLITTAIICVSITVNIFGFRYLPLMQNILAIQQVILFVLVLSVILALAPRLSAKEVFASFKNLGGWPNRSLALLVGQMVGIAPQVGFDAVTHISEEVQDAARNVPRAMMYGFGFSIFMAILLLIIVCFAITNTSAALADPTGYAIIWVYREILSPGCLLALLTVLELQLFFANISYTAPVARDLFAFARDQGLPFSKQLSTVNEKLSVPVNALLATGIFSIALSSIYIGSEVAFYALVSLSSVAILLCYMTSIGAILWRKINYRETIAPAFWSLGKRFGICCNAVGLIWLVWCFFWSFWPLFYHFKTFTFNWAVVVFVGVLFISTAWYVGQARKIYKGPVVRIKRSM